MSFLRHGEIYPCEEGTISRPCPRSSPWMSLQLVIPGRLPSGRARFRFTSRSYTANVQSRPTMLRQPTAKCRLTDCLSPGVQSTCSLCYKTRTFSIRSQPNEQFMRKVIKRKAKEHSGRTYAVAVRTPSGALPGRAGSASGVAGAESFPGVRKSVKHSREISKRYSTLTTAKLSRHRTGKTRLRASLRNGLELPR